MLNLPSITLICLTNRDFEGHKKALDKSCEEINFGAVKLIWDEKCTSIDIWNYKIIYELPNYVQTKYALLIHADGFITNPSLYNPDWLQFDYIGAPWPLPTDSYSYRDEFGGIVRVGNSVSLRSKRLMDLIATKPEEKFWAIKEKYGNTNEDGFICCHNRKWLESQGCKFAPISEAITFSHEHDIPENKGMESFAFHAVDK